MAPGSGPKVRATSKARFPRGTRPMGLAEAGTAVLYSRWGGDGRRGVMVLETWLRYYYVDINKIVL